MDDYDQRAQLSPLIIIGLGIPLFSYSIAIFD
jgi:hypothetical protein